MYQYMWMACVVPSSNVSHDDHLMIMNELKSHIACPLSHSAAPMNKCVHIYWQTEAHETLKCIY